MNRFLVTAISLSAALATPSPAFAQLANSTGCGSAYLVLPNGKCVNLEYTTILGTFRSRAVAASAQSSYVANLDRQITRGRAVLGMADTEEDKRDRQKTVQAYQQMSNQANQNLRTVEDAAYPVHMQAMSEVCRTYKTCAKY